MKKKPSIKSNSPKQSPFEETKSISDDPEVLPFAYLPEQRLSSLLHEYNLTGNISRQVPDDYVNTFEEMLPEAANVIDLS